VTGEQPAPKEPTPQKGFPRELVAWEALVHRALPLADPVDDQVFAQFVSITQHSIRSALSSDWTEAFSSLEEGVDLVFSLPELSRADPDGGMKQMLKKLIDVGMSMTELDDLPITEPKIEELVD
jgi:hypothetical protein